MACMSREGRAPGQLQNQLCKVQGGLHHGPDASPVVQPITALACREGRALLQLDNRLCKA